MHNFLNAELKKYGGLKESEYELVQGHFKIEKISKGDFFLTQGEICTKLGFLVSGFIRTYTVNEKGNDITTHFGHEGQFIVSFFSFKNQTPSFESVRALEDSNLLTISYNALHELFHQIQSWEAVYRRLIEESYACMEQRNYILQNRSAREKYAELIERGHPSILQKASLGQIASYLGITQETLSRIRRNSA